MKLCGCPSSIYIERLSTISEVETYRYSPDSTQEDGCRPGGCRIPMVVAEREAQRPRKNRLNDEEHFDEFLQLQYVEPKVQRPKAIDGGNEDGDDALPRFLSANKARIKAERLIGESWGEHLPEILPTAEVRIVAARMHNDLRWLVRPPAPEIRILADYRAVAPFDNWLDQEPRVLLLALRDAVSAKISNELQDHPVKWNMTLTCTFHKDVKDVDGRTRRI